MDPRGNPFAPGAGTKPPELVGRDSEIESFEVLLDRLSGGTAGKSMIVTGLRGVGKTVLLNTFEDIAVDKGWVAAPKEFDEYTSLPEVIARLCRRALRELRPSRKLADKLRDTLAGLGSFTLAEPSGFEITYNPESRNAEVLGEDFVDLLLALGQAAAEKGRGVVFLFDEVQFVDPVEFGPFVVGLHRLNQKALPVTCVAVGLPSLPALAGEAKSYAERLFDYPRIDRLKRGDADEALRAPAARAGVTFSDDALRHIYTETEGYPYFLQEYGKYIWDVADDTDIDLVAAKRGGREAQDRLDEGFYRVRYHRATPAERLFLIAMRDCDGPPCAIADVVHAMGRTSQSSISPQRDALIKKGLIYSPRHGTVDFTVPRFADYMLRHGDDLQI